MYSIMEQTSIKTVILFTTNPATIKRLLWLFDSFTNTKIKDAMLESTFYLLVQCVLPLTSSETFKEIIPQLHAHLVYHFKLRIIFL